MEEKLKWPKRKSRKSSPTSIEIKNACTFIYTPFIRQYRTVLADSAGQPAGLRRGSAAARLLLLRFRIPSGAWMLVSVMICQVQVFATGRSLTTASQRFRLVNNSKNSYTSKHQPNENTHMTVFRHRYNSGDNRE